MKKVAVDVERRKLVANQDQEEPIVNKIDITRDLKGFFFAADDWTGKYMEFKVLLEEQFHVALKTNSNSFNSCFQYEEKAANMPEHRRFKVYNKGLQLL